MANRVNNGPLDLIAIPQPRHITNTSAGRSILCHDSLSPRRGMVAHKGGEGHPIHRDCLFSYLKEISCFSRPPLCPDCGAWLNPRSFPYSFSKTEIARIFLLNSTVHAAAAIATRYGTILAAALGNGILDFAKANTAPLALMATYADMAFGSTAGSLVEGISIALIVAAYGAATIGLSGALGFATVKAFIKVHEKMPECDFLPLATGFVAEAVFGSSILQSALGGIAAVGKLFWKYRN